MDVSISLPFSDLRKVFSEGAWPTVGAGMLANLKLSAERVDVCCGGSNKFPGYGFVRG